MWTGRGQKLSVIRNPSPGGRAFFVPEQEETASSRPNPPVEPLLPVRPLSKTHEGRREILAELQEPVGVSATGTRWEETRMSGRLRPTSSVSSKLNPKRPDSPSTLSRSRFQPGRRARGTRRPAP